MNGVNELAGRQARQEWQRIQNRVGDFERREWPRFTTRVVAVDSAYTVEADDGTVLVDTSSTAVTVTLPTAVGQSGRIYTIKDATGNAETNNITIDGDGSETIDGAATHTLDQDWAAVTVQSDGANWLVVDDAGAATAEPAPTYVYARLYATLADAVTAAQAIGAIGVLLEPGTTYAASGTVTITTDNLNIIGGPGTTINHTGTLPAFNIEADNVQFHGIKFSRASASGSIIVYEDCTGGRVDECWFYQCGLQVGVSPPTVVHENLRVSNSRFESGNGNGLTLLGVRTALIDNCYFYDYGLDGIKFNVQPCENITVLGCTFIDNNDGHIDFYGGGAFGTKVIGCYFYGGILDIKNDGTSGMRPTIGDILLQGNAFGPGTFLRVNSKFIPFTETNSTVTGDGATTVFNVAHHLNDASTNQVRVRIFNGATELTNPTDFSYTTPAAKTVQITFTSPVPNGATRQVNIMGGLVNAGDRYETTLTSGSSSYPIAHNLGEVFLDVRAYNKTTQLPATISSITYTDRNNITVNFSGALAADHRLLIWKKHQGIQGLRIVNNTFFSDPGDSFSSSVVDVRGCTNFWIQKNFFRSIAGGGGSCIEIQNPPQGLGVVEGNYFWECLKDVMVNIAGISPTSSGVLGVSDTQGTIIVRDNTAYKSSGALVSLANVALPMHRVVTNNHAFDAYPFIPAIANAQPGYMRDVRDNFTTDSTGAIVTTSPYSNNTFADGDTTPDVSSVDVYLTANTNPTTITDLDGELQWGTRRFIRFGDGNTTIDFSGTNLKGNGGVDWTPGTGDAMECTFYNNQWYCSIIEA